MAPPLIQSPRRWRGLPLGVVLFIVLPLAALTALVPLGSLTLHAQAMRSLVADRDQRAAAAAAETLSAELGHLGKAIRGVALTAAATHVPDGFLSNYSFLSTDFEGGLALYRPDGQLVAASGAPNAWQGRPVADLLARASNPQAAEFSPAFLDPSTGQYAVLVAAAGPAGGPGDNLRAIGAFFPASLARRALSGLVTSGDALGAWVVDVQGQLLYLGGQPKPEGDVRQHAGLAQALRGESGSLYVQVAGSEHVVAFSPVPPVGWALVIEEPWEAVDNPLLRTTLAAPLILIPVVLIAVIAIAFGLRQIVQPLRALARNAAELGWGRFDAIEQPVGGIAEIRHLQAELIQMAQKVKVAQQNLRDYMSAITLGQEDERRRLASGLHDGTVQSLIALDQRVQMAQMKLKGGPPEAAVHLAEVRQMTAGLIEDVRRVIRALRPIYLEDLGLLPALEMLTRDVEKNGLQATFSTMGVMARLSSEREIVVYRVAQEALSNVARHSAATAVQVTTSFEGRRFTLRVEDNGQGFAPPERVGELATAGHYGLIGMQERAQLIGGQLTIQSASGHGTALELRLPL
jgi:signal transduction histidine kinase